MRFLKSFLQGHNQNSIVLCEANRRIPGKSHKAQWDKFSRQCLDRKQFPIALASHVLKNKNDVFVAWLEAGGDWSKVEMTFQRKASDIREVTRSRGGMKKREILKNYPEKSLILPLLVFYFLLYRQHFFSPYTPLAIPFSPPLHFTLSEES